MPRDNPPSNKKVLSLPQNFMDSPDRSWLTEPPAETTIPAIPCSKLNRPVPFPNSDTRTGRRTDRTPITIPSRICPSKIPSMEVAIKRIPPLRNKSMKKALSRNRDPNRRIMDGASKENGIMTPCVASTRMPITLPEEREEIPESFSPAKGSIAVFAMKKRKRRERKKINEGVNSWRIEQILSTPSASRALSGSILCPGTPSRTNPAARAEIP